MGLAIVQAGGSRRLQDRRRDRGGPRRAAALLEVDEADVEGPADGGFRVVGAPERAVGSGGVIAAAARDRAPAEATVRDAVPRSRSARMSRWSRSTRRPVTSVSCASWPWTIAGGSRTRSSSVGNSTEGSAQGAAQALFEAFIYDEGGNPLTTTLATYPMPSAPNSPRSRPPTPRRRPRERAGVKGIGESARSARRRHPERRRGCARAGSVVIDLLVHARARVASDRRRDLVSAGRAEATR